MYAAPVREREREEATPPASAGEEPAAVAAPPAFQRVPRHNGIDGVGEPEAALHSPEVHRQLPAYKPHERAARQRLRRRQAASERFAHELEEMREVHDLDEIDDDVEQAATLYEWQAAEHTHRPKSPAWFAGLAAGTTMLAGIQALVFANIFGAITIGLIGSFLYFLAQQRPKEVRYRILIDGMAVNSLIYHWRDLDSFNVIYKPGTVKTVIFRNKRTLLMYVHAEIGNADPVEIRRILLEFLREDQDLVEPFADVLARRLGF